MSKYAPSILFAALVFLLPLAWPGIGSASSDLLPKRLLLYLFGSAICASWLWSFKTRQHFASPLLLSAIAYVFWNLISQTWSVNPFTGFVESLQLLTFFILCFAFIDLDIIRRLHTLTSAATAGGLIVSLIGIMQYLGLGFDSIPSVGLPSSTFIFRNLAAAYLLGVIPLAVYTTLREQHPTRVLLWLLSLSSMLLYLFYTRTRGAWISLAGAFALTVFLIIVIPALRHSLFRALRKQWIIPQIRWGTIACIVLLMAGALRPAQTASNVIQQFDEKKATATTAVTTLLTPGSDRGRFAMWQHTLHMIADHPILGVGLDNWEYTYPIYDKGDKITADSEPVRPHNDILWIASELGLIGLGFYIWLILVAVRIAFVHLRTEKSDGINPDATTTKSLEADVQTNQNLTALIALTGIAALIAYSLFSFPKEQPAPSLFFWLYLAILGSLSVSPQQYPRIVPILGIASCLCGLYLTAQNITFDVHYNRARAFEQAHQLSRAHSEITQALQAGTFDHRARFLKAQYLQKMNRNNEAITAYQHALEAHPNYAHSHHNLGGLYAAQKAFPQAIASYKKALALRPTYYQARLHLGNAYAATGQIDLAIKAYARAITDNPNFAQAHTNLGALYLRQNKYQFAIASFEQALRLQPDNAQAHNNLAYAYEQTGRVAEAIAAYENLLKYWTGDADYRQTVREHIADLRQQMENN